jgi:tripartite-type tricarboxylate transporter receptor subunit TctC
MEGPTSPEPTATAWGDGWFAVVAPAGTPASIVARLNQEIAHFLADPGVRQRILGFGLAPSGSGSPEATTEFIRADQERWRGLVKELGSSRNDRKSWSASVTRNNNAGVDSDRRRFMITRY